MKKTILRTLLLSAILINLSSTCLVAQNDTPTCYAPLAGGGQTATVIVGNQPCSGASCNSVTNVNNIVDANRTNFAQVPSTVTVLPVGSGITVQDNINTYPAGYIAGYLLDLGGTTLLNTGVLSLFTISTFNNGAVQESKTSASLATVTAIGTSPGRVYVTFKTTLPFDEVRFTLNSALTLSPFNDFRVYYALAFDSNCGFSEDNGRCGDQIGGASSIVTFNGGQTGILTSIASPGNITDGSKNSFATITLPIAASVIPGQDPYVGVLHEQQIYAANTTVGFVVSRPSILTLDVLNNVRLQTYLFGVLQDDRAVSSGSIAISAFTGAGDRTTLSMVTTKQYNEVRLVLARTVSVSLGTLNVYYAFEQPNTCSDCLEKLINPVPPSTPPFIINNYCPGLEVAGACLVARRTDDFGVCGGTGNAYDLIDEGNVINADTNNYASYRYGSGLSVGIACGFQVSVKLSTTTTPIPGGTIVGYVIGIDNGTANLINTGILGAMTIVTYRNNAEVGRSTNANLLGLNLLSNGNGDKTRISFRAPANFDEVQFVFSPGVLSAGLLNLINNTTIRTYYPFVIRDTDNDGIPNCQDQCATGNDAIDTDSDGITDCFAIILPLTLNDFTAKAISHKQVLLSWQTLNEINTKQFIVERSTKPNASETDWQAVGTLAAAGTLSASRSYQLTDNQPINGTNYYRLRITDKDGKQSLSEIRQVNFKANGLLLSAIYPNPVVRGKSVTIAVAETVTYRLLDNTGRLVSAGKIPVGTNQLKVPATAGTYLLEIAGSTNNSNKEHQRIIVQ